MRRRFGVQPHISITDQVFWFEWPSETVFDAVAINNAIKSESLAVRELFLIGTFTSRDGELLNKAFLPAKPLKAPGQSASGESAAQTLHIVNHADAGALSYAAEAAAPITPKEYKALPPKKTGTTRGRR